MKVEERLLLDKRRGIRGKEKGRKEGDRMDKIIIHIKIQYFKKLAGTTKKKNA